MYVLDTSALSTMFRNYYPTRFRTLWKLFDEMTDDGLFTSTREARRELEDFGGPALEWCQAHVELFVTPDVAEASFVSRIYAVSHFQQNIERQKLLKGGKNADPFLIARAAVLGATVVTTELPKQNGVKIPNICDHFGVKCLNLEAFMIEREWVF
jgi:hypothetical protein